MKSMNINKNKYNFYASLFGKLWMSYHFMWIEVIIASIVDIVIYTLINIYFLINYSNNTYIIVKIIGFLYVFIKFIIFGVIGNRLLLHSLKVSEKKMSAGIFDMIKYFRETEKNIVFRGISIVTCIGYLILISYSVIPAIVGYILY